MKEEQSRIFDCFLKCVRNSVQNRHDPLPELSIEEWRGIFRLAEKQELLPLLCEEAAADDRLCHARELSPYFAHALQKVTHQIRQVSDFLHVYDILLQNGLRPVIIKGVAVRHLYSRPYHRPSVDEDILIRPEEFPLCHRTLLACGLELMFPEKDVNEEHEVSYVRKSTGLYIEVHKLLFAGNNEAYGYLNSYFADAVDMSIRVRIKDPLDKEVFTIGGLAGKPNDESITRDIIVMAPSQHLFFLVCHALKHFIHSGIVVRHLCDIAVFAQACGNEIDWEMFWKNCEEICAGKFVFAMISIAEKNMGFTGLGEVFRVPAKHKETDELPLLYDMMEAGLCGDSAMTRLHSSTITLHAVEDDRAGNRKKNGKKTADLYLALRSVFLPLHVMKGRYRYLNRYPFLLPAAWIQRIFCFFTERRREQASGEEMRLMDSVRIGKERIRLLETYGIIGGYDHKPEAQGRKL